MPEGLSFNIKHENISGLSVNSCNIGTHSDRYIIKSGGKASLTLGNISIRPSGGHNVTILVEGGGHLDISDDGYGNASMTPVADEGYIFDGFYDENGKKLEDSLRIAKDATWTVKFIKK